MLPQLSIVLLLTALAAAKCPGPVKCTQGVNEVNGVSNNVHFWDAEKQQFQWSEVEINPNEICAIGFTTSCEIRMLGTTQEVFGRENGCQYNAEDNVVYCVCNESHQCNVAVSHYAPYAQEAFRVAGLEIEHNCPETFSLPQEYLLPEACELDV